MNKYLVTLTSEELSALLQFGTVIENRMAAREIVRRQSLLIECAMCERGISHTCEVPNA